MGKNKKKTLFYVLFKKQKTCTVFLRSFSTNLLAFYHECFSLIQVTLLTICLDNTVFLSRNYQTDSSETQLLYCLHCLPYNFFSAHEFKSHIKLFSNEFFRCSCIGLPV